MTKYLLVLIVAFLQGCSVKPSLILTEVGTKPDYSNIDLWAAHPGKLDSADATPSPLFINRQKSAVVDVFFLHPTTYTGRKQVKYWNAPLLDEKLVLKTDQTTILHQASIFNAAGRVYAPRYRQAHLHAYFTTKNREDARLAFATAYEDIRHAFLFYLEHYNRGRPIIIAAHSQGSTHAMRLLREFFDGQDLSERLVVAYLVGMPVPHDYFKHLNVCQDPDDLGCFCSWRTYKRGYIPKKGLLGDSIYVTNPLSWRNDGAYVGHLENRGGVLQKFHKGILPRLTDAKANNGILWASKPKFPGSFLMTFKNYHVADYNLYWVNVRENARLRSQIYLTTHPPTIGTSHYW